MTKRVTNADLQAEIEALRFEIDLLKARLLIAEQQKTPIVLPAPNTYPHWWQVPTYQPQIWCGTGTTISSGPSHDEQGRYIGPTTMQAMAN